MAESELAPKVDIAVENLLAAEYYGSIQELSVLPDFHVFFVWYHRLTPTQMQLFNRCFLRGTTQLGVQLKQNSHRFNHEYAVNKTYVSCTAPRIQEVLNWYGNLSQTKHLPQRTITVANFSFISYGSDDGRARLLFDLIAYCISKEAVESLLFDLRGTNPLIARFLLLENIDNILSSGKPGSWVSKLHDLIGVLEEFLPDKTVALIAGCLAFETNITVEFLNQYNDQADDSKNVLNAFSGVLDLYHNPDLHKAAEVIVSVDSDNVYRYKDHVGKLFDSPADLADLNKGKVLNAGFERFLHDDFSQSVNDLNSTVISMVNNCANQKPNVYVKIDKHCADVMRDVSIQQVEFLLKQFELKKKQAHVFCVAKPTSRIQYLIPQFDDTNFHLNTEKFKFEDINPDQGVIINHSTSQEFRAEMIKQADRAVLLLDSAQGVLKRGDQSVLLESHKYTLKALQSLIPLVKGQQTGVGCPVMIWCRFAFNIDNYDEPIKEYLAQLLNMYYFYYYPPDHLLDLHFTLVLVRRPMEDIRTGAWADKLYPKTPWELIKGLEYYRRLLQFKILSGVLKSRIPLVSVDALKAYVRMAEYQGNCHLRVDYRDLKNVHTLNDITGLYDDIDVNKFYTDQRQYLGLTMSQKRTRKRTGDTKLAGESHLASKSLRARAMFAAMFDSRSSTV